MNPSVQFMTFRRLVPLCSPLHFSSCFPMVFEYVRFREILNVLGILRRCYPFSTRKSRLRTEPFIELALFYKYQKSLEGSKKKQMSSLLPIPWQF